MNTMIIFDKNTAKDSHFQVENLTKEVGEYISQYGPVRYLEIKDDKPLHEYFFDIRNSNSDLYITIDGAGFNLRTESDKPSYNQIHGRFFHIFSTTSPDFIKLVDETSANLAHFHCFFDNIPINERLLMLSRMLSDAELI